MASSSDIRKDIISKYDVAFKAVDHSFDETKAKQDLKLPPTELSLHLARQKSLSLNKKFKDHMILGCDQICSLNGRIFSKPLTVEQALVNLSELSGKTHQLIGSYSFTRNNDILFEDTLITNMTMKNLSKSEINDYVATDLPLKSCGSYMFEKNGYNLFSEVEGSLEAINGLPFAYLLKRLNNHVQSN